ncbi:alkaline phosphatase D family protein [Cellulophaga tyrosinoxydans]|uniref:Alkaline phosphatase D n=1 Tax=Cellulophaga tyrosinoxydans TaxID=504486 RepID=A0A1W2CGT6_9FLAO|nr:alkaline phosphatase D family protein [Cellulophaga tyrosinoxydans]SMC84477.1 alkaline phosphatase D [Cellulophaga tyrosinoxydans]
MKKATRFFGLLFFAIIFNLHAQDDKKLTDSIGLPDFTIAFGSCNKHNVDNLLWDDVLNTNPDVWIWGGDIIYADTDKMPKLRRLYTLQDSVPGYMALRTKIPVIGTWDDHDYGLNDGGEEFKAKKESQQEFLDFLKVPKDSPRRSQEGVYASHVYNTVKGSIKVIVLDTRYFRTALTEDTETRKRNKPNAYGDGTVLGAAQWQWLSDELTNSTADFNVIVSSIQVLSNEHGFETWGNFPHEVDKLKKTIVSSKAKGVVVVSGDRHISEFSRTKVDGLAYPLIDFTSSGLTHTYSSYSGESNPYRVGEVVFVISFGVLEFNFNEKQIHFKMIGDNGKLLGELKQGY